MIPLLFRNCLINRGNQSDSAHINFIGNVLLPLLAQNYLNTRECLCLFVLILVLYNSQNRCENHFFQLLVHEG